MEPNGRLKINPILAWTIATYLVSIGLALGTLITKVDWLAREQAELTTNILHNTRSRQEGDVIIKRFDELIQANIAVLSDHESRLRAVEKKN